MCDKEFKELVKIAVEKLKDESVLELLQVDVSYQKDSNNEGSAEDAFHQLDLTEKQRAAGGIWTGNGDIHYPKCKHGQRPAWRIYVHLWREHLGNVNIWSTAELDFQLYQPAYRGYETGRCYAEDDRTVETLFKALEVCNDDNLSLALNLDFSCSLRMGEMPGLTWDCIDISEKSIKNDFAYIFVNKERQRVNRNALEQSDRYW